MRQAMSIETIEKKKQSTYTNCKYSFLVLLRLEEHKPYIQRAKQARKLFSTRFYRLASERSKMHSKCVYAIRWKNI